MVVFLEKAEEMEGWVGKRREGECFSLHPPADLGRLQEYIKGEGLGPHPLRVGHTHLEWHTPT